MTNEQLTRMQAYTGPRPLHIHVCNDTNGTCSPITHVSEDGLVAWLRCDVCGEELYPLLPQTRELRELTSYNAGEARALHHANVLLRQLRQIRNLPSAS